jgi:hypothetical protein
MLQGLESSRLLLLMSFGALCALAGLFLLFRPPKVEGETRLELLGMKFNAASGGVIVFLIGAAFLAAPIFVPERSAPGGGRAAGAASKSPYAPVASVAPDGLPVRQRAEGREVEPNDSFDAANRLEVGKSASGTTRDSEDWFILPLNAEETKLEISVRNNGGSCFVTVYSSDEKQLTGLTILSANTKTTEEVVLPGSAAVLVQIRPTCDYELFTAYAG